MTLKFQQIVWSWYSVQVTLVCTALCKIYLRSNLPNLFKIRWVLWKLWQNTFWCVFHAPQCIVCMFARLHSSHTDENISNVNDFLRCYTLRFKKRPLPPYSHDCCLYNVDLTDFYNITYTVNWFNFQHNSYWLTHLTYILLLHYLGKQVKCKIISLVLSTQPSYTLHSLKQHPVYVHNQSFFKFNYSSKCSKYPLFPVPHALPPHSSIASSTMLCDKLFHVSVKRCLRSVTSQTGVWYTR